MVEKQYDILKKERGKGQDDLKVKPDENGIQESAIHLHENGAIKSEVSFVISNWRYQNMAYMNEYFILAVSAFFVFNEK